MFWGTKMSGLLEFEFTRTFGQVVSSGYTSDSEDLFIKKFILEYCKRGLLCLRQTAGFGVRTPGNVSLAQDLFKRDANTDNP